MRVLALLVFLSTASAWATTLSVRGTDAAPWHKIFGAVGIEPVAAGQSDVTVLSAASDLDVEQLATKQFVIVEGFGKATQRLGFQTKTEPIATRHIVDIHAPKLPIYWADPLSLPAFSLPAGWQIFAQERWSGTPVMAGKRVGKGGLLWIASSPGPSGIERYPYLLQAAFDLGLEAPLRTNSLWAFFDSAYRIRADPDFVAQRWREAGISVLHAAAWHNMEPNAQGDAYLKSLIEACHRHSILVYAWLELPHVSEQFWAAHPEWREKTAIGQDAQLDWRKLMNLQNADCRRAVEQQVSTLLQRFDWDGVNIAELYFESLEGAASPARFTPMNDDVRRAFQSTHGFDPKSLFDPASPHSAATHPADLKLFLDFRAALAAQLQSDWLGAVDRNRQTKPYLDVILTHIDDRFEPSIRDALGADVARMLPALQSRRETLLVEDPATLWNLGPDRYAKLAEKYAELTSKRSGLAVDINIVERYQDVYPTKKQTGIELLELVHQASQSFHRVALYVENSIEKQDLSLLPFAAVSSRLQRKAVDEWLITGESASRMSWLGPAEVDGKVWPVQDADSILLPAGKHRVVAGITASPLRITDFNGELTSASAAGFDVSLSYESASRAIATVQGAMVGVEVDGAPLTSAPVVLSENKVLLVLPSGQHLVSLRAKQSLGPQ